MAERAIFLDRDNTIIANDGYLGDPSKVKLLPGAAAAIASLRRLDYRIIVVSNQSGVARGMFDEAAVEAVNAEMVRQLREQAGAHIDASYYCPFHPDATVPEYRIDHDWRKPKPGMLKAAAETFGLDLSRCWMIGDMPRDIAAGTAVGCRTILLSDPESPPQPQESAPAVTPGFVVRTLADAARIVLREGNVTSKALPAISSDGTPAATLAQIAVPAGNADPGALADAVAARIFAATPRQETIKPLLEEMLQQLRHLNRHNNMTDFSLSLLLATVCQMVVLAFLAVGAWDAFQAAGIAAANGGDSWWYFRVGEQLKSLEWFLAAIVVQGIVIAFHLHKRNT